MNKQLLLLSMILFSSNASASKIEISKHFGKGFLWSSLGSAIITSTISIRFMKIIQNLQAKINNEGEIKITSKEDLNTLIQEQNKKTSSVLQTILPFALTIPAGYCFVQMWNNYTSALVLIKN